MTDETPQTGDEVTWITGRGYEAISIVGKIQFGKAHVDWFGLKLVPIEDLKLIRKSNRRLSQERREAELAAQFAPVEIEPKKRDFFTEEEIETLEQSKLPESWTMKADHRGQVTLVDSQKREWIMTSNYTEKRITLTKGAYSFDFIRA